MWEESRSFCKNVFGTLVKTIFPKMNPKKTKSAEKLPKKRENVAQ